MKKLKPDEFKKLKQLKIRANEKRMKIPSLKNIKINFETEEIGDDNDHLLSLALWFGSMANKRRNR